MLIIMCRLNLFVCDDYIDFSVHFVCASNLHSNYFSSHLVMGLYEVVYASIFIDFSGSENSQ